MPPPSTVSTVRASRFGVTASKSCDGRFDWINNRCRCKVGQAGRQGRSGYPTHLQQTSTFEACRPRKRAQPGAACSAHCQPGSGVPPTHLQDEHAVGVAQDLVGVGVVAVADVGGGDKEGEGVLLLGVQQAALDRGNKKGGRVG